MTIAVRVADYLHARIAALYADPSGESEFWDWLTVQRAPLIEPDPLSAEHSFVTHVWQTNEAERYVVVQAGWGEPAANLMTRIAGTRVCFASYRCRNDLRTTYRFAPNMPLVAWDSADAATLAVLRNHLEAHPPLPDPHQREHYLSVGRTGRADQIVSMLSLPGAPDQSIIAKRPDVARGSIDKLTFKSNRLGNERRIWVYTPPGYEQGAHSYPLVVLFDGGGYLAPMPAHRVLDNLLADGRIKPAVAVFIDNATATSRNHELPCNADFAYFLEAELLPWLGKSHRLCDVAADRYVGGASFGGLAAMWMGLRLPHVFGNVISQAASLWWGPGFDVDAGHSAGAFKPEWLIEQYANSPRLPVRFWLEIGLLEHPLLMLAANRRMKALLTAKGYDVTYSEPCGGHDESLWRGTMARALEHMLAPATD